MRLNFSGTCPTFPSAHFILKAYFICQNFQINSNALSKKVLFLKSTKIWQRVPVSSTTANLHLAVQLPAAADAAVDGGACRAAGWRAASGARAGIRPRAWLVPVGADPTPPEAEGTSRAEASAHPRSPEGGGRGENQTWIGIAVVVDG